MHYKSYKIRADVWQWDQQLLGPTPLMVGCQSPHKHHPFMTAFKIWWLHIKCCACRE